MFKLLSTAYTIIPIIAMFCDDPFQVFRINPLLHILRRNFVHTNVLQNVCIFNYSGLMRMKGKDLRKSIKLKTPMNYNFYLVDKTFVYTCNFNLHVENQNTNSFYPSWPFWYSMVVPRGQCNNLNGRYNSFSDFSLLFDTR